MKQDSVPTQSTTVHTPFQQTYFHGTKADLKMGDMITVGYTSNFGDRTAQYIYMTATLDPAVWGAELANGAGKGRIYLVEPTGEIEDDPNLTDKKYPGNPTKSYRTQDPLKIVGEVTVWQGHPEAQIQAMKMGIAQLQEKGIDAIED